MTAPLADARLAEVEQFLDVWDAAPVHRARYRDVISSQKSGDPEGGRKLRATTLRDLLAEVKRLRGERDDLAALLLAVDEIAYEEPAEFARGLLRQAMYARSCRDPHPLQNQVFCARFPGHTGYHANGQQCWVPTVRAVESQPEATP
jgi:hypothetical protein